MAFFDTINRYLAYRLKEIELRVHTWKRAKEISKAYDTRGKGGAGGGTFAPKASRIGHSLAAAFARAGKGIAIAAAALVIVLVIVLGIKYMPPLPSFSGGDKTEKVAASAGAELDNAEAPEILHTEADLPEDAELPEAAVLPEGYVEVVIAAADTAAAAAAELAAAQDPATPPSGDELVSIFQRGMPRGLSETGKLIFADKSAKILYIFTEGAGGWEIERAYPIATGQRDGRKQFEGDKKTPEGVYHIVGRKHKSELTNLYGPAAFILDYPNEDDRAARRTGHGIWIHGSDRGDIPPLYTQGCLAVSNPDILDVAGVIGMGIGIPVIIVSGTEGRKHLTDVDFRKLKTRGAEVIAHHFKNEAEFKDIVLSWKTAWEKKDINAYSEFYSASTFRDGTQTWEAFRERKMRTFAMYATIDIELTNIALTELTSNLATVKFFQLYATNLNRLDNAKRLIFRKENGTWKIHREITFPKEELLL